ncbi:hypothetical protein Fokcrypt_00480 [Candidatus Fokinia cryptica]|uniref:Uncharacterized protein n=1 Tax=Candidatus Fokinia crypta TaxID=1920990 RepID=A0ABZ0UV51_9RICK|nr:hypothetical protein Fokcrypt_00480 [Candidatus Fokinia cryptica]
MTFTLLRIFIISAVKKNSKYEIESAEICEEGDLTKVERKKLNTLQKVKNEKIAYDDDFDSTKRIVGIVKPHGFWTKFIMERSISRMYMNKLTHKNRGSFWVTLLMLRQNNRRNR